MRCSQLSILYTALNNNEFYDLCHTVWQCFFKYFTNLSDYRQSGKTSEPCRSFNEQANVKALLRVEFVLSSWSGIGSGALVPEERLYQHLGYGVNVFGDLRDIFTIIKPPAVATARVRQGQKQKILYLFSCPGVTKLTLMLFIKGNNWANLLVLLK